MGEPHVGITVTVHMLLPSYIYFILDRNTIDDSKSVQTLQEEDSVSEPASRTFYRSRDIERVKNCRKISLDVRLITLILRVPESDDKCNDKKVHHQSTFVVMRQSIPTRSLL